MNEVLNWLNEIGFTPVATGTLVLSLLTIVIAVAALRQAYVFVPKPVLVDEGMGVWGNSPETAPVWRVVIWNRGNGLAHNLTMTLHSPALPQPERVVDIDLLDYAKPWLMEIKLTPPGHDRIDEMTNRYEHEYGPIDLSQVRLLVTWRQAPNMTRLRKATFRAKLQQPLA